MSPALRGAACAVLVAGVCGPATNRAFAQSAAPAEGRLAVVVADSRVFVYPTRVPGDGQGWIISRDGVRLTLQPLTGAANPDEFGAMAGADLPLLQRITAGRSLTEVYRRLRSGGTAAGVAQVLSPRAALALGALYVDSTVAPGATHTYTAQLVRLTDVDVVLRQASATVRVMETPVAAPPAPRGRVGDGAISLEWMPPRFTGAATDIVVAYVVERADSTGAFERISALPVLRQADQASGFRDEAVEPRRLYRYRLRSADLIGRLSEPGASVAVRAPDVQGPLPPPQVATAVTDGRIRVVWTVSPDPEVRGFVVERAVGGDSVFRSVTRGAVPAESPEWTDTIVRGREIYTYRVRAVDRAGRVGQPSNPTTTRGLDERPPAAPLGLAATPQAGHRVRITWQAVPDRDLRGYEVHRTERGDTVFARLTSGPSRATAFVDSGYGETRLEPGREYVWHVVAVDSSGNVSAPAEARLRLVDDEPPEPARSLGLRNHLGRQVEIVWTASPSVDVAAYVVERVDAGAPIVVARVTAAGDLAARDTTARRGATAIWRVIALDSAGNRAAALEDTLTFRDLTRPPTPHRLTAVREATGAVLRWERVVSADLRGYVVYRAERSDGPRTRLGEVPAPSVQFVDRAAPAGARYVVRAVDASGNESAESPVAVLVESR